MVRKKVELLEDILRRYGVAAGYWPLDESVPAPEKHVDRDVALLQIVEAGADPRAELLAAVHEQLASGTALPLALGDIRATNGQSDAALRAYEFAVLAEDDPARLCELGYLLFQRCRVDELPLCDKDFEGDSVEFPGGEEALIFPCRLVDFDNPGPEFPRSSALLDVAIRAFGRAYVRCVQRFLREMGWPGGDKWHDADEWLERTRAAEDKWHELVALDGLRAAFMEADDLDGLESVIFAYVGWVEDYEEGLPGLNALVRTIVKEGKIVPVSGGEIEPDRESPFYLFEVNFFKAQPWLRARRKAPPSGEPELTKEGRLLLWHLRELSQQLRDQQGRTEQWDSLLQSIEQKLESTPKRIVEASRKRLAEEYGNRWEGLPLEVQRLVAQAEFLRSTLETVVDADWAPVAMQYSKALESMLRTRLGPRLDKALREPRSYTEAIFPDFLRGLRRLAHDDRLTQIERPLRDVINRYRNPAAHPGEVLSYAQARELKELLLETQGQRLGLLWKIASLCNAD